MNRPRFLDFRTQVAAYSQSVGSPLGVCVSNLPALAGLLNIATEQLLNDPNQPDEGFYGTWIRSVFTVSKASPYITLPRGIARAILIDVCSRPTKIQNGFFEFLDYGIGLQPNVCSTTISNCPGECGQRLQAYDRETVATFGALASTPQFIRIFPTDPRDVDKTVLVQGSDHNGQIILSTDPVTGSEVLGEQVVITLPFSTTVNQFQGTITGLQKDVTAGPLTIMQVDPVTGATAPLSTMEPTETSAAYRRYLVNGLPANCCSTPGGQIQITAMLKLDFVPVVADPDYLIIPCIPALISQCESIRYSVMDNAKAQALAEKKHARALSLLFGQLDHVLGKERPAISVPLWGSQKLRSQPV